MVHLNGTSREVLLEQTLTAARAIQEALIALDGAAPNARDYYPMGDDAWRGAQREFEARRTKLKAVYDELLAMYEAIEGAGR